jgi:SPP1 gp7 family putative phage head morphogenesis protein
MPRRPLTEIATRHQVFLERLKTKEADGFAAVFDALNKATRKAISALNVANLNEVTRRELNAVLSSLREENQAYLDKAQEDLFSNLEKLAGYEAGFEARSFGVIFASRRLKVPEAADAFAHALARPLSVDGSMLKAFVSDWSQSEVMRVNNVIQKAWGEGWTVDRLTSAINGTKRLGYADGILGVPDSTAAVARRNARSVARTAVQHVASSARMATWEKNADAITGYRFVATLDSRTTQTCRSLDGRLFELGAGPVPPLHVNCRSTTVAECDPALDFLDEGATRSSENGYVDANLSYYDWLKTQSAEFQDEAIGPTRGKLFRDGGLSNADFAALNLGRNFQPLTLEQMKDLEPLAFKRAGLYP